MTKELKFEEPAFLIEVAYKSGYSFRMWFTEFEIRAGEIKWQVPQGVVMPVKFGVDDIVSIIQLDIKEVADIPNNGVI